MKTIPAATLVLACSVVAMPAASQSLNVSRLVSGLEGGSGSTVGPAGDLYVTEGAAGRISRVDPKTGEITTFATGLPLRAVPIGGAIDIAPHEVTRSTWPKPGRCLTCLRMAKSSPSMAKR